MNAFLKSLAPAGFAGTVLVTQSGRVLVRQAVGLADAVARTPNSPETKFRIGSITKVFTASAIMLLEQQRRLRLTDSVCMYLASCPAAWRPVTLRNLLTHTSGIPDYLRPITLEQFNRPTTPEQLLALVQSEPLLFPPGNQFAESNTNSILLGLVIERVSGQPWDVFLKQRIFVPLHMMGSGYERDLAIVPGHATGYGYKTETTTETIPTDEAAWADGGLYSTVDDLDSFATGFFDDSLVSPATRTLMLTPWGGPGLSPGPNPSHVSGLGWFVEKDSSGHSMDYHGGGIPGFGSALHHYPDTDTTVAVLSNFYWGDAEGIALEIGNVVNP